MNKKYVIIGIILLIVVAVIIIFSLRGRGGNTPVNSAEQVKVFYIALEDNGQSGKKVGCGDSSVSVNIPIQKGEEPLRAALEALINDKRRTIGTTGYLNSLHQSSLRVDKAIIEKGIATVKIEGNVMLGGVCDDPRFVSQIKETVMQFADIKKATILVNDKPIDAFLSQNPG